MVEQVPFCLMPISEVIATEDCKYHEHLERSWRKLPMLLFSLLYDCGHRFRRANQGGIPPRVDFVLLSQHGRTDLAAVALRSTLSVYRLISLTKQSTIGDLRDPPFNRDAGSFSTAQMLPQSDQSSA